MLWIDYPNYRQSNLLAYDVGYVHVTKIDMFQASKTLQYDNYPPPLRKSSTSELTRSFIPAGYA